MSSLGFMPIGIWSQISAKWCPLWVLCQLENLKRAQTLVWFIKKNQNREHLSMFAGSHQSPEQIQIQIRADINGILKLRL